MDGGNSMQFTRQTRLASSTIYCILCAAACVFSGNSSTLRAADEPKPLIWAADAEGGAPYIYKDPEDRQRNIGFEVDLAKALARELGRPIVFKQYQFHSLVSGLQRGDFDLAMNGLEV